MAKDSTGQSKPKGKQEQGDMSNVVLKIWHKNRPSPLSSESPSNSFRGLMNFALILLVFTNFRLVVANLLKYGILWDVTRLFADLDLERWPTLLILLTFNAFIIAAWILEILASKRILSGVILGLLHSINITGAVIVPSYLIGDLQPNPAGGIVVMLFNATVFMKLVSYAHTNSMYRSGRSPSDDTADKSHYPRNLTLGDIYYFMAVPTLCYELHFPRTERIRKRWLLRRILELLFLSSLVLFIVDQYVLPAVQNTMPHLKLALVGTSLKDFFHVFERVLKLAVPNVYIWLLGFYCFFHLYMNILAEILRFADREFYKDWWNATSTDYFWRTWNMPVHNWMARHLWVPMRNFGIGKIPAAIFCFFVSAIWHEVIIGIPLQTIKLWAFGGMMAHIPLGFLTRQYFKNTNFGNVVFWLSILLGQPLCILLYYHNAITTAQPSET